MYIVYMYCLVKVYVELYLCFLTWPSVTDLEQMLKSQNFVGFFALSLEAIFSVTRGIQKVRRATQLTTRYAHRILSLFNTDTCN